MKKSQSKKFIGLVLTAAAIATATSALGSEIVSSENHLDIVSESIIAESVIAESILAESIMAESLMADAVAIESMPETVAETSAPERLDFSALITNPGKNTLIALSRVGNNYGKWEQDQNGDMFFVFSGSKRSGNVATNGWYAIEDKEVDEKIVASPSDKVLAQIIAGKKVSNLSDAEITKMVGGRTFSWYHFDSEGRLQTGWFRDGKDTYFLSEDEGTKGKMVIGEKVINGSSYMFSDNPEMLGVLQ